MLASFQFSLRGFTDRAVKVLAAALERTAAVHQSSIVPERILFALATVERGPGRVILEQMGLDVSQHLPEIESLVDAVPVAESEGIPALSMISQDLLNQAKAHAREMGHNYIGTEHLVLGLLSVSSPASRYLLEKGISVAKFKDEAVKMLTGGP